MEEKFQLLKVRAFTDVINDSIAFARRYIKQFGYVILIYVVPVFIVGSFLYSNSLSTAFNFGQSANMFNLKRFAAGSIAGTLVLIIGRLLLTVIFMSTFLLVEQSENGEIDAKDITGSIRNIIGRLLGLYLILFVLIAVVGGLVALLMVALSSASAMGAMVLIGIILGVGLVYVSIPLTFVPMIYVREGCEFGEAFSRAFFLVKDNWWWTFLIVLVAGMIGAMAAYVFQIPYLILVMMKTFTSVRSGHVGYDVGIADRLALALSNFGTIITSAVVAIATLIQYYSLVEKKDGVSLMEQIDNIGSDTNSSN